jgi:hypothetical protein
LTTRKLRLIVLGMMGRCPFGGQTWLYLNWLRGLAANGHDVWYVEDDTVWPYDPAANRVTDDCTYAVRHVADSLERVGLGGRWAFRLADRAGACWNMTGDRLDELYRSCDALLNIVGATGLREEHLRAPCRVYVETDPVTAELRAAAGDSQDWLFETHDAFVTYGENYGAPDCGVPLDRVHRRFPRIHKTRQPIDLDLWPAAPVDASARYFTTIGNYRQAGADVTWNGQTFHWSKHHEWERFADLPSRTSQPFELAMQCTPADRAFLERRGWRVVSPQELSLDIFDRYPDYFRRSRAEFTVAKDQNVRLKSGWFSERDACYLASGKPVVSQGTGFANVLPTGQGLFAFTTHDDALAAIDRINCDYATHCAAARDLAVEYFDAKKVAAKMIADLGM